MKKKSIVFSIFILFAILGIINAGYLSVTALSGNVPTCNFIHGCDLVAKSPYSYVFGIPLALFGVFFYTMILGFSLWGFMSNIARVRMYLRPLVFLGFLLSLYFLYLQAFVIHAYCEYCLFSLFDATVLFITSFFIPKASEGILSQ